eukprot:CAMPEP_0202879764 /NCGR_PEP_ID=MMETSP1391-20130828/34060_1 /ASSEMBLY_ACC=CAM_ASM_000867 /TAXON_ID=1034604 /ORGANISM="Chlamydomonas leiostraca, Strain SAG 11-49" /LENGTH=154 /DNA_ID=CAMNT_0049562163 /DNA_START=324 /DNA_END=790 /DNA_ORIENTATION=-
MYGRCAGGYSLSAGPTVKNHQATNGYHMLWKRRGILLCVVGWCVAPHWPGLSLVAGGWCWAAVVEVAGVSCTTRTGGIKAWHALLPSREVQSVAAKQLQATPRPVANAAARCVGGSAMCVYVWHVCGIAITAQSATLAGAPRPRAPAALGASGV